MKKTRGIKPFEELGIGHFTFRKVIVREIKNCKVGKGGEALYWDITRKLIMAQIKSLDLGAVEYINWKTTLQRIVGQINE